jgi:class 3 adenylate cyclase
MAQSGITTSLAELLGSYRTLAPAERRGVSATIESRYGAERTILIGDMPGFTRRVEREGIVHYLSLIFEMRRVTSLVIERHGGYLFKADADNVFGAFFTIDACIDAALEIQRTLERQNRDLPEEDQVAVGLGLAHGKVLAIEQDDVWGQAINFAAKLGEDLAGAGEILAHESVIPSFEARGIPIVRRETEVSGVDLPYGLVDWRQSWTG